MPKRKGIRPLISRRILPAIKNKSDARSAFFPVILIAGRGLLLVLFIIESASLSVYWFIEAEPEERKNTPAATIKMVLSIWFPDRKYPVTVDRVTAAESLYFARSAYDLIVSTMLFSSIKGFQIIGYCFNVGLLEYLLI